VQVRSAADDYLVYEQTIAMSSFKKVRNTYRYKYTPKSSQPDAITSLWFDVGKNKFYLKDKNIDLTGLGCPLYILINTDRVDGLGVAGEDVVNGKKSLPIRLMSGYADTLAITKTKMKNSSLAASDHFYVKGTFTVAGDSTIANGLTITVDGQTFFVPGDQFSQIRTGRFKSKYTNSDRSLINADLDFINCKFTIDIRMATIDQTLSTVSFGLAFGDYNQNVDTHL
jgi:hypothetical protein